MGSHFLIAAPDSVDPEKWVGVYGHFDGNPVDTGQVLFAQIVGEFQGDLTRATAYYINMHRAGWRGLGERFEDNECYCHTLGEGTANTAYETERHASSMGWTYILRPEGLDIRKYGKPVAVVPWARTDTVWEDLDL